MRRRLAALGAMVVLAGLLVGCADDEPRRAAPAEPSSSPTEQPSSPAVTEATEDETALEGGTAESPVAVEPTTNRLEWTVVPGPATSAVTRSGQWTLTVNEGGTRASVEGGNWRARFVRRQKAADLRRR